jgi:hypothetical protein
MVGTPPPFAVTLYDKAFTRIGFITDPVSVTCKPRHNGLPTAQLVVPASSPFAARLIDPGTRITIDYHGTQLISGQVSHLDGSGAPDSVLTAQIDDHWRLLSDLLGWPTPTADITFQGGGSGQDVRSGPAETVVKGFVNANKTRLGVPLTVAPDLGRGSTITVTSRMHPLIDRLLPVVDHAGIGISVKQVGAGLVLDCYVPTTYPLTLTANSGVVTDWKWTQTPPTITRAVVGDQQVGAARAFRIVADTALEAAYGHISERFVSGTSAQSLAQMDAIGATALKAGGPVTTLTITLAETGAFQYGVNVKVGDKITAALVPGASPITDVLTEAQVDWNIAAGLSVQFTVGPNLSDERRLLYAFLGDLANRVRDINART